MTEAQTPSPLDPELSALPRPRRPFRTLTIVVLALTAAGALALAASLRQTARFALRAGPPVELGELGTARLDPALANTWVHGKGGVAATAAEYHRPLDPDTYRLVPSLDVPRLYIELRIAKELPAEHYLPPASFVGRLVPLSAAGPERAALSEAAEAAFGAPLPADTWILEDGQAPSTSRWALGLIALLIGFFAFSAWGLARLLLPSRAAPPAE